MAPITNVVVSLALVLPFSSALPRFWPHGYGETPYPTLTLSSSEGVSPTAGPGTTGTGTGTAYYPTATGTAYTTYAKRDADHPYGFPPPYQSTPSSSAILPTGMPTASSPPIIPTYIPTGTAPGTAPSASGTGMPAYPSSAPNKREVDAAKEAHRQHFEGPRKRDMKPYYPIVPRQDYGATGTATGTAGPTATGVMPTGTTPVPLPTPTGTISVIVPAPSGTGAPPTGYENVSG